MKVRQDPPAHSGYNGKQGGERFRTILKYPVATDMAMKRYRVNDAHSDGDTVGAYYTDIKWVIVCILGFLILSFPLGVFITDIYQIHDLPIRQRIVHDYNDPMLILLFIWMVNSFLVV